MSICDRIVVMKDGVLHQQGKPQEVYDDPANLFVATFLGTPPINVFTGRVEAGQLYLGEEAVLPAQAPDGEVTVAIRPEAFRLCPEGRLTCRLDRVEIMGRDVTMVCDHDAFTGEELRAIIPVEEAGSEEASVRFDLKKSKVFLFDPATGKRLAY